MGLHWHVRYAPNTKSYYAKSTEYYGERNKRKGKSVYLHVDWFSLANE